MATRKQDKAPSKGKTTVTETKTAQMPRASMAKSVTKKVAAKKPAKDGSNRGRPALLDINPEIQTRIVSAVRGGNYIEVAAAFGGISKETLYAWLRKGAKDKDGPYKDFSDSIQLALAEAEVQDVSVVNRAALGVKDSNGNFVILPDWKASAWRLERRNQSRWNSKVRIEKSDTPDPKDLSDEELLALLQSDTES